MRRHLLSRAISRIWEHQPDERHEHTLRAGLAARPRSLLSRDDRRYRSKRTCGSAASRAKLRNFPGSKIVADQDAWLAEQAVKKVGDILTANPHVDIIWAANEGGTVGAVMAVKNAGKAGRVAVFGTDNSEQLSNFSWTTTTFFRRSTGSEAFRSRIQGRRSCYQRAEGTAGLKKKVSLPGFLAFTRKARGSEAV